MIVMARIAPGVTVSEDDFADLTTVPVRSIEWTDDGRLAVQFEGDLSDPVRAAVRRRMQAASPEEEALLDTLADPAPAPTASLQAQVDDLRARVETLTRLVSGETEQESP